METYLPAALAFVFALILDQLRRKNKELQRQLQDLEGKLQAVQVEKSTSQPSASSASPLPQPLAKRFDTATGLPTRESFLERVGKQLKQESETDNTTSALILMKLDGFRTVRDGLGEKQAEELLMALGHAMPVAFGANSALGRLSEDEFAILVRGLTNPDQAAELGATFRDQLSAGFSLPQVDRKIGLTATLGVAPWTPQYQKTEDWMADADSALGEAQNLGAGRLSFYSNTMHMRSVERWRMEGDLRTAIDQDILQMHFQPIVHLPTGQPAGFEALVRWMDPIHGFVSPADFIPVAEKSGLIGPIGELALRQSCAALAAYRKLFPDANLFMSINLSPIQLQEPGLTSMVQAILAQSGVPAQSIKLEITETAMAAEAEKAKDVLQDLRHLGVSLSLDDFGTGYSSMAYLDSFPVSTLKIDRSFITEIAEDEGKKEIVRAILQLAQGLNLEVIGEGVETSKQKEALSSLGCNYGQGWLFSKALPADEVPAWLKENQMGLHAKR